jgi:Tol biopolymer transport system component
MRRNATIVVVVAMLVLSGALAAGAFGGFGDWSEAESIETYGAGAHENFNTPSNDGCPFISADGKKFFIASNRPGTLGMNDIWVSTRANKRQPWGEPVNLGPEINTIYNDFCPTLARDGKTFYFASNRPGYCGTTQNADLYTAKLDRNLKISGVTHLGCVVNSGWDEHSPFPLKVRGKLVLFYSSARPADATDAAGDHDLYSSRWRHGAFQAGTQLAGINTTANEGQPNVRKDGREIFFWSDRVGTLGAADIYSSTRKKHSNTWSAPQNLGPNVNSAAAETRPSLSSNGKTLYFGTTRDAGGQPLADVYVTTRSTEARTTLGRGRNAPPRRRPLRTGWN